MLKRIIAFFMFVQIAGFMASAHSAAAGTITEDMVNSQYNRLEKILNNRGNVKQTIQFLHRHISEDATFKVTVTNPDMAGEGKSPVMELDKQAYINSYIQGPRFVDDYEMNIQTLNFEPGAQNNEAYTLDVMTERGKMMNALNDGKPFVSRTTCRTRHKMDGGKLRAVAGECHTDISFEEEI